METIDPGYGWEIHPQGDEYYAGSGPNVWVDRKNLHPSVNIVNMKFRRRIDPGEGWEIVPEEEVRACKGFNRYSFGKWWTSYEVDVRAVSTYRRRKSAATQPPAQPSCQWVKASERLPVPKKLVPVFFADHGDGFKAMKAFCYLDNDNDNDAWLNDEETQCVRAPDYWLDAPEPPKPEPVDEAEEAWMKIPDRPQICKEAFKSGFRAGQQSNKGENK